MSDTKDNTAALNLRWAQTLFAGLVAGGVRDCVISPGSRSTPLVLAADEHPFITTHLCLDERVAGFFALGLGLASKRPVALIATSGSAPAHWYPAVIEASHTGVALILLTADRPPELHEFGANQTTNQQRLFGTHVRAFYDPGPASSADLALHHIRALAEKACQQSIWPHKGAVQINLPLREPLVPATLPVPGLADLDAQPIKTATTHAVRILPDTRAIKDLAVALQQGVGMIVCGPEQYPTGFAQALASLQQVLGAPILADPLSGLRFGPHLRPAGHSQLCVHYDSWLRNPKALSDTPPTWILQFGRMPVSRVLSNYLARAELPPRYLIHAEGLWHDPGYHSQLPLIANATALCEELVKYSYPAISTAWLAQFMALEQHAIACKRKLLETETQLCEGHFIQALLAQLPKNALIFSSNSLPIRQFDTWSGTREHTLQFFANRGVSGIDGNLATLLGLAKAHKGLAVGVLGDLALVHDIGALFKARGENVLVVVINNGGGGIFGYLPQASLENFERYWQTPHPIDIKALAALFEARYYLVDTRQALSDQLDQALTATGVRIMELRIDAKHSQTLHRRYFERVANYP